VPTSQICLHPANQAGRIKIWNCTKRSDAQAKEKDSGEVDCEDFLLENSQSPHASWLEFAKVWQIV
jgi:hypothetical protein